MSENVQWHMFRNPFPRHVTRYRNFVEPESITAKVAIGTPQPGDLARPEATRQPGTPDCQMAELPECRM